MKQIFLSLSMLFLGYMNAQAPDELTDAQKAKVDWFHKNIDGSGVFGVADDDAIKFLDSKGLVPQTITVAVLDSGVEVDHPDLKENIWTNSDEVAGNNKDDDGNGYIDDVHGWNFLGNPGGQDVSQDTYEMTRIVKQYQPMFEGKKAKKYIKKMPEQYAMYKEAKQQWQEKIDGSKEQLDFMKQLETGVNSLLTAYAPNQTVNQDFINGLKINNPMLLAVLQQVAKEGDLTLGGLKGEIESEINNNFANVGGNLDFDPRSIVGDDYKNLNEKNYGNNDYEGPDAMHGTHVAGIIAAKRDNGIGMNGIAGNSAKIMSVRTVPDGDERDKDVANAILYAADNGAKIMNMSFGKDFSPYKEQVWKAIKYADQKGILMFHAAGNDNKDVDKLPNFPTNFEDGKCFTKNWVTVGSSTKDADKLRSSFSNYGTEKVDLFAPGSEIYSTVVDSSYMFLQGTSMASPAAAGCAALLWSYFPKLSSQEIRDLLMSTVNVSHVSSTVGKEDLQETRPFDQLSVSGGVVDVNKAAHLAFERYGTSKSVTK